MMLSLRVAAIHCQSRRRRRRRRCCFFGFWLRTICWKAPAQRMDQISLSLSLSLSALKVGALRSRTYYCRTRKRSKFDFHSEIQFLEQNDVLLLGVYIPPERHSSVKC